MDLQCNTMQCSCYNCQLVISEIPTHFLVKHPIVQTKASTRVAFNLPISGASCVNSSNRSTNWSTIASLGTAKTLPAIAIQLIPKYAINICQYRSTSVNWQLVSKSHQVNYLWPENGPNIMWKVHERFHESFIITLNQWIKFIGPWSHQTR